MPKKTDEAAGNDTVTAAEAVAGDTVSRDERHDSIDPTTGLLTEEAQQLRRERAEKGD